MLRRASHWMRENLEALNFYTLFGGVMLLYLEVFACVLLQRTDLVNPLAVVIWAATLLAFAAQNIAFRKKEQETPEG